MGLSVGNVNVIVAILLFVTHYTLGITHRTPYPILTSGKVLHQCDNPKPFAFFWQIKRLPPSPPSYFLGTIHVPYSKVLDHIPKQAISAFCKSHRVIFEINLTKRSTRNSMLRCQHLPNRTKLEDVIPRDLYHRIELYLKYAKRRIPMWMSDNQRYGREPDELYHLLTKNWTRKRPIWVLEMLNKLTENEIKNHGITLLDNFLAHEAKENNKEIDSVERVKDQCAPLNGLKMSHVLFALNQTLTHHESGNICSSFSTDELIYHYNCGTLGELFINHTDSQFLLTKNCSNSKFTPGELEILKQTDDYLRLEFLVKRNKRMSHQVLNLLNSNRNTSLFFVFGAGHLIGENSIIELIQASGLEVVPFVQFPATNSLTYDIDCPSHFFNVGKSFTKITHANSNNTYLAKFINQLTPSEHQQQQYLSKPNSLPDITVPHRTVQLIDSKSFALLATPVISSDHHSEAPVMRYPVAIPVLANGPSAIHPSRQSYMLFNQLYSRTFPVDKLNPSTAIINGNKQMPYWPSFRQQGSYSPTASQRNSYHNRWPYQGPISSATQFIYCPSQTLLLASVCLQQILTLTLSLLSST